MQGDPRQQMGFGVHGGRLGSNGSTPSASRANSGAARTGSGRLDPLVASEKAARAAAAAAVKQVKRENATLQARLQTTQERLAEADGSRIQALKALQEAWKRIDDLEQKVAAARAEGHTVRGSADRQLRETIAQSDRLQGQLQGLKAELAAVEAKRAAEAGETRKALGEIDCLQARLAAAQEEAMMDDGTAITAVREARAQADDLRSQVAVLTGALEVAGQAEVEAANAKSQIDWLHNRLQSSLEEVQVGDEALQQALGESREEAAVLHGQLAAAKSEAAAREAAHTEALDAAQDQLFHFQELTHKEQLEAYAEVQRWASIAQEAQRRLTEAGIPLPPPAQASGFDADAGQ